MLTLPVKHLNPSNLNIFHICLFLNPQQDNVVQGLKSRTMRFGGGYKPPTPPLHSISVQSKTPRLSRAVTHETKGPLSPAACGRLRPAPLLSG